MNFKYYLSIPVLLAATFLGSCSDNDDPEPIPIEFKVSASQIPMLRDAGTETFYVESNSLPSVATDGADWVNVGSIALNGMSQRIYAVNISVKENTGYDTRRSILTVSADGQTRNVEVVQSNNTGIMLATPSATVSAEGGALSVAVRATGEFSISMPEWIVRKEARSLSDFSVNFMVSPNNSGTARSGEIRFTLDDDPERSVIFTVNQESQVLTAVMTAKEVVSDIYAGWNLGNSLEATGSETAWGNPRTTKALIDAVKAAGFNAVRIPCAWNQYLENGSEFTISQDWINRVKEVVSYVTDNNMYAIINIHWDGGWLEQNANAASQEAVCRKQREFWTQIANAFGAYGDHLLFAGCNEVRDGDNWGMPSADNRAALEAYNQTFVDVVRATGGNNATRNLIVQSWCCNPWRALDSLTLPTDNADDHLLVEVHFYDPFYYSHPQDNPSDTQTMWGYRKGYVTVNDQQENYIDELFLRLRVQFVNEGVPVILGEYGSICHSTTDAKIMESQAYYLEYVTKAAKDNGIAPFYWDNGAPGEGSFGIINRTSGAVAVPHMLNGIMKGASTGNYPF